MADTSSLTAARLAFRAFRTMGPDPASGFVLTEVTDRHEVCNYVEALEKALGEAIQVIEWCGLNDRTEPYEYGDARRNGDRPTPGATFNTPREFARYWPEKLKAVLGK